MEWPALSPDLNPIEHVWDQLDRRVRKRRNPPLTIQEVTQALIEEWESIPQESLRRLVRSMPRRCEGIHSIKPHQSTENPTIIDTMTVVSILFCVINLHFWG
jgi:hypothetical protein